ncbi:M13-type metalloendopeptidase [Fulvivirga sedimenti]|uniref:M13 family peptidase n=1 Tax=Fulvivirga sedimenti TaxID=2879465 RepID=A0A9X1HTU5_9BACT|nr:M13-type metalloendopeptidase [Fulvivirga sedimenti]MCA6075521.1 hypothetical protein [Fulvivirga sedimenti]MCA6076698.1 hypothetical protein [Fulvivirga sedimenti]MCA6077826.1 hypothetical protein [Fulvivirga sedimenti]
MRAFTTFFLALLLAACSTSENKPALYVNTTILPGNDFYHFVNGNWQVDSSKEVETVNLEMRHRLQKELLELLKENHETEMYSKIYDFYHSLADPINDNDEGASLTAELALLDSFQLEKDVIPMMAAMFRRGYGGPISGEFYARYDQSYVLQLKPGSVQFDPVSRSGPNYNIFLNEITEEVQKLLGSSWTEKESGEVASIYHKINKIEQQYGKPYKRADSAFYHQIPHIGALLGELGLTDHEYIELPANPLSFQMDSLIAEYPLSSWKIFYTYTIIKENDRLFRVSDQYAFEILMKYCNDALIRLHKQYHYDSKKEAGIKVMAENIRRAMISNLRQADWLDDPTRDRLSVLFDTTRIEVSYPSFYEDYSSLVIKKSDPVGNYRRAREFQISKDIGYLGAGKIPPGKWRINTLDDSPTSIKSMNTVYLPIAFNQYPLYSQSFDEAYNYGGLGFYIGHEMAHLVDFNSEKIQDVKFFNELEQKLISQYGSYLTTAGDTLNGRQTINENFSDIMGLSAAYKAFSELPSFNDRRDGYTGAQRFFMAFANSQREYRNDVKSREFISKFEHSLYYLRVNGAVRNLDAFYEAFDVTEQDSLYLVPDARIRIW